jgi:hypothetical protein
MTTGLPLGRPERHDAIINGWARAAGQRDA